MIGIFLLAKPCINTLEALARKHLACIFTILLEGEIKISLANRKADLHLN
jgi:hypothetical protein